MTHTSTNDPNRHSLLLRLLRKAIQYLFLATILLIGFQFAAFVDQLYSGAIPTTPRPPGVEGFLPISALISLKYWLVTGIFNRVHPSGLVIFLMVLATAVLIKRAFCSWVCPIGLLSDHLHKLNELIFRKPLHLPNWADYPLRSLKYLLLGFFLWAVWIQMDAQALHLFIYSPYNRVADIKMLHFFTRISSLALWILVILAGLSLLVPYFWCRYLCPYGALLGSLSLISLFKIRREPSVCIDCRQCSRSCPAAIKVHNKTTVRSDECHGCLNCVGVCPEKGALEFALPRYGLPLKKWAVALVLVTLFAGGSALARRGGIWQNALSIEEYRFHVRHLSLPIYQHNEGRVPDYQNSPWQHRMDRFDK